MQIAPRTFNRGTPDERRFLVLTPDNEEESKLIDEMLGDRIPVAVKGTVELADGYGQHYIRLEADTPVK